jgi:hypothetical protein
MRSKHLPKRKASRLRRSHWLGSEHTPIRETGIIIPIPGATGPDHVIENSTLIKLSAVDKKKVDDILARFDVAGHRQIPGMESNLWT